MAFDGKNEELSLWLIQELWPTTVTQPMETLVLSVAWYHHVHNYKVTAVFWGIEGESLDTEALTMKGMVHWETT